MKYPNSTESNQRSGILSLSMTAGLALLLLTVLLYALTSVSTTHADPGILYVDGASGQDIRACGTTGVPCRTVSYTLNSRASTGDTIRVAQGVYTENLGMNIKVTLEGGYAPTNWTRDITVHETTIDGSGATDMRPVIDCFEGSAGSTLDGLTVRNGDAYDSGGGVFIASGADGVTVRNCKVISNRARGNGGGIAIIANANATITGCTIVGNVADTGGGLYIDEGLSLTVANNVIASNVAISRGVGLGRGGGLFVAGDLTGTITGNEIISNTATGDGQGRGGGIFLGEADLTLDDNFIRSNKADAGGGVYVTWGAKAIIRDTQILRNSADRYFGGGILVRGEGTRAAIRDSLVAENQTLESGGAGIVFDYYSSGEIVGNTIVSNTGPAGKYGGGGIQVSNHASADIRGNFVAYNQADAGAGVKVTDNCTASIADNQILSNTAAFGGGGIHVVRSAVTIAHNVVSWNAAKGGAGLNLNGATGEVYANTVASNQVGDRGSGGMYIGGGSAVTLTNNIVVSNASPVTSSAGDGVSVSGDTTYAQLLNNVIAFNSAEGVQTSGTSTVLIRNNIIAKNSAGIHDWGGQASASIDHNDVWENGWANYANVVAGTGDISADPLFIDSDNNDYHLQLGSPCIDKGTSADAPLLDFEGDPRPLDGDLDGTPTVDMGADEFVPHPVYLPLALKNADARLASRQP